MTCRIYFRNTNNKKLPFWIIEPRNFCFSVIMLSTSPFFLSFINQTRRFSFCRRVHAERNAVSQKVSFFRAFAFRRRRSEMRRETSLAERNEKHLPTRFLSGSQYITQHVRKSKGLSFVDSQLMNHKGEQKINSKNNYLHFKTIHFHPPVTFSYSNMDAVANESSIAADRIAISWESPRRPSPVTTL